MSDLNNEKMIIMLMRRIVHFDLPADDPNRAQKFYSEVFGWKFAKWDGPMEYWMITTGDEKEPGINGCRMDPSSKMTNFSCLSATPTVQCLSPPTDSALARVKLAMTIPNKQ
jgi:predicted enzyme related to lactoylglutathione lyase